MAELVFCSSLINRYYSLSSPPSPSIVSAKPGLYDFPLFKVKKFSPSYGRYLKLIDRRVHLKSMSRKCSDIIKVLHLFEQLSTHQFGNQFVMRLKVVNYCLGFDVKGKVHQNVSATAFLVSNALIWTMPLQALAETCEADNSFFNMPLLLFVALIGATVGGLLARQRRGELQRLNEQLRQINAALRRQAKIESYAPTLSYAPVGSRIQENEVIVDPRKEDLISKLKAGKNFLRNQDPEKAFLEFKAALELAQTLEDPIEEKKAARGLGASLQRQGKYRDAIKYHSMVLAISKRQGEESGNTEAYGAIADCYTELGDLERAGRFYDEYIARLEKD